LAEGHAHTLLFRNQLDEAGEFFVVLHNFLKHFQHDFLGAAPALEVARLAERGRDAALHHARAQRQPERVHRGAKVDVLIPQQPQDPNRLLPVCEPCAVEKGPVIVLEEHERALAVGRGVEAVEGLHRRDRVPPAAVVEDVVAHALELHLPLEHHHRLVDLVLAPMEGDLDYDWRGLGEMLGDPLAQAPLPRLVRLLQLVPPELPLLEGSVRRTP